MEHKNREGDFVLFITTFDPQYKLKGKMYDYDGEAIIDGERYKLYGDRMQGVLGTYVRGSLYHNTYRKGRFTIWKFRKNNRSDRTPDYKGIVKLGVRKYDLWGKIGVKGDLRFISCKMYILDREMNYKAGAFRASFMPRDFSNEKF